LIRFSLSDTHETVNSSTSKAYWKDLWVYRKAFCFIVIATGLSYANYMIALVLMNSFVPLVTSIDKSTMASLNTSLLLLDFVSLPVFGWIASKSLRERFMLISALAIAILAAPLCALLYDASLGQVIAIRICIVLLGTAFCAPFQAWAHQLVPKSHRYILISLAYAIGSQLLGSPTAALSLWAFKTTGIAASVSWYWLILAASASVILYSTKPNYKTKDSPCLFPST